MKKLMSIFGRIDFVSNENVSTQEYRLRHILERKTFIDKGYEFLQVKGPTMVDTTILSFDDFIKRRNKSRLL